MSCDKGEECVALTRERDEALAERDGAQLLVDSLRGNLALMLEGHDHEMADLRAELLKYQTLHHNTETRLHEARAAAPGEVVIDRALIIALGVALTLVGVRSHQVGTLEHQAEAWRRLYLAADSDAKYVNCLDVDNNFVVCEKSSHVQDRR